MSADSGPGNREIARRLYAAEFDDASLSYSESDEERAPNYVVTPTGARVNRLFAVGVLTEVEQVNEDSLRGRVVDPTGAFVTYAGQYQPDEHAFLSRTEPPTFVALSGKARTFEPEDSDRVFTSVRPESINEVEAQTRDRWVVSAAERTLHRIAVFAEALDSELRGDELRAALEVADVDASLAAGIPKAIEHYDTGYAYLEAVRSLAVQAVEQVAGERDSVDSLETDPGDASPAELGALPDVDIDLESAASEVAEPVAEGTEAEPTGAEAESGADDADAETGPVETESKPETTEGAEAAEEEEPSSEPATTEASSSSTSNESEVAAHDSDGESPEPSEESTAPAEDESDGGSDETSGESKDEDLGDFDAGESVQETVESEAADLEDFDPEETVDDEEALTESEREEVKEEFGTEFSTGSEVGEPGEAGIDVPSSEEELEEIESEVASEEGTEEAETDAEAAESAVDADADDTEVDTGADDQEADAETDDAAADVEVDLEDAVVDAMAELDEGDGADHEAVVAHVVDDHGVDPDAVEDAIQDAMMSGKCYEPSDGSLKAI